MRVVGTSPSLIELSVRVRFGEIQDGHGNRQERAAKARDFIARYRRARYRGETLHENLIELARLK